MSDRDGAPPESRGPDRVPPGDRFEPGEAAPVADRMPEASPPRQPTVDPFEPYRPAEPTLRADLGVEREFDEPFDTGQLRRLSTGQLLVVHRPDGAEAEAFEVDTQRRVYSWIAAIVGALGAAASLFVGWMLPLSIAAIVFGVLGLRREDEGRTLAFVGIGTGIAGLVFSAVWIGYYAIVFGALPH